MTTATDLPPIPGLYPYPAMAKPSYPVYVTTAPAPAPSPPDRRGDREERGRGRTSGRERDRDLVDYVHDRDRLPRPPLKHREASRDGKRRHEYRYYSPHRSSSGLYPRSRSEERMSPAVVKEVAHSSSSSRRRGAGGGGGRRHDDGEATTRDQDADRPSFRADKVRSRRVSIHEPSGRRGLDRRESRRGHDDDGKGGEAHSKRKQAAQHAGKSAIAAGALEAVRQRGSGGGTGDAWKRVATAALGAAAIDAAATKVRHKDPRDKGKGSMLGASIGGLVVDSLVNKLR